MRVLNILPSHVQAFQREYKTLAPATQARMLRELSVIFNYGIKFGYLPQNPCADIQAPRLPQNPPKALEKETIQALLRLVHDTPYYGIVAVAAYAGLRREEIVWLDWEDIDLRRSQIYVRNKPKHPLKDYMARTVPVPEALVEILSALPRNGKPVFTSPKGKRWQSANLSRRLAPYFRKLGIPGALHILRHTYASHLVMGGADLASVQKLLGHSQITTTMIYAHVAQEHLKEQVKKLGY